MMAATKKAAAPKKTAAPKKEKPKGDIYSRMRDEAKGNRGGNRRDFWKPAVGSKAVIRLLPFTDEDGIDHVAVPVARHWGLEDDEGRETMAVCGGDECPICDLRHVMDKDEFKRINAQTKYLVNCVVRSHVDNDDKDTALVAELTYGTYQQMVEYMVPDGKFHKPNCLDLNKGYDFSIVGKKTGKKTEYVVKISEKSRPVGMKVEPEDLTKIAPKANPDRLTALAALLDNKSEKED